MPIVANLNEASMYIHVICGRNVIMQGENVYQCTQECFPLPRSLGV